MQTCGDIGLLQLITTDLLSLFSTRGALVSFGPEKVERNVLKTIHLQSTPSLSSRVIARQCDEMRNFGQCTGSKNEKKLHYITIRIQSVVGKFYHPENNNPLTKVQFR